MSNQSEPPKVIEAREQSRRHCNTCFEPIHPSARICPHCRSAQATSRWATLGSALKWIGSITALLSLIFALVQLRSLVADKVNRDRAVDELVTAARYQADAQDIEGAWNLACQAMKLNPVSPSARSLQVHIAMQRLRSITRINREEWRTVVDMLVPVLHRGIHTGNRHQRADILAHLSEANRILYSLGDTWLDTDHYTRAAFDTDPGNVFAHAWNGIWLLRYHSGLDSKEELALALDHFRRAIQSGREREFARSCQSFALRHHIDKEAYHPEIGFEVITIGQQLKNKPERLSASVYGDLAGSFRFLDPLWDRRDEYFQRYPPHQLLEIYTFLCRQGDWPNREIKGLALEDKLFIEALLLEADNQIESAFSSLTTLLTESQGASSYCPKARRARERLWEKQGYGLADTFFVKSVTPGSPAQTAGLHREDIVLRIHTWSPARLKSWQHAMESLAPGTPGYAVKLLRGNEIITLSLPNVPLGMKTGTCRVPAAFLDAARP